MESSNQGKADRTLVIMAKAPKPGTVKTRLAHCLSPSAISELYCCFLHDTLALARSLSSVEVAIMCPASDAECLMRLAGGSARVVPQAGEGLAAGLASVFERFTAGAHRVVAFNSDSPHLPASALESAFDSLATCDVVVGPTHDGGYYLVGAKATYPGLFNGDGMGTSSALERLLERTRELGLSLSLTDTFYDIDVEGDLIRLAAELQLAPAKAPRTAEWLKQWAQLEVQLRTGTTNL
jgi:uncharacterized protein